MITYLAVFALGAVLGALAFLCVVIIASPPESEDIRLWNEQERAETIAMRKALDQQDEIRRRYESECG